MIKDCLRMHWCAQQLPNKLSLSIHNCHIKNSLCQLSLCVHVILVLDSCSPLQHHRHAAWKKAGTLLWGGIKHSGSFRFTRMFIKLQMTVGAGHIWALSNKLSHSKDENKSGLSEKLSCDTSSNVMPSWGKLLEPVGIKHLVVTHGPSLIFACCKHPAAQWHSS